MKIASYTLGCKVNTYETNAIMELFLKKGYEITDFDSIADIYLINTCSVTNMSDVKSRKQIRKANKKNPQAKIIVMGCYSQKNPQKVKDIKGVFLVAGTKNRQQVVDLIEKISVPTVVVNDDDNWEYENLMVSKFNHTRAFLKIQDGCNNYCSYCIIPYTRGRARYKDFEVCIEEVKTLVKNGYKEIVLTGIHTGSYPKLNELIKNILIKTNIERLRISSMELTDINEEFLSIMKNEKRVCNHLHLPLQSGCTSVLARMNRKYTANEYIEKIERIRALVPEISITTDLIVGFPEETEEEFLETIKTIKKIGFSYIHIFPFSSRDGTKASLLPQLNGSIIKDRIKIVNKISIEDANKYANLFLNKKVNVIAETYSKGQLTGHSDNYLKVKFAGNKELLGKNVSIILEKTTFPISIGNIL